MLTAPARVRVLLDTVMTRNDEFDCMMQEMSTKDKEIETNSQAAKTAVEPRERGGEGSSREENKQKVRKKGPMKKHTDWDMKQSSTDKLRDKFKNEIFRKSW